MPLPRYPKWLLVVLLAFSGPLGQISLGADTFSRLILSGPPSQSRWVEVTPAGPGPAGKVFPLQDGARAVVLEGIAPGLYLVCAGAEDRATRCERLFLEAGQTATMAGAEEGVRVTGRIFLGRTPAPGVAVRVVPQPLPIRRLYTFPLYRQEEKLVGQVTTDEQGRFVIPQLAAGDYRLELRPPGGRIDHGDPFTVPKPRKAAVQAGPSPAPPPVLDLGDLILGEGLTVEVLVTDSAGQPIPGAGVGAGQERAPNEYVFFESYAGKDGKAVLSGIDGTRWLGVTCQVAGYVRKQQRFDTVPASVVCAMERLSAIEGKILNADGKAVEGATISVRRTDLSTRSDKDGGFELPHLVAGDYRLSIATPGYRAVDREVALAAEARHKLEPIRLEPADTLAGVVVDGPTGEPVAEATLTVQDPPGAGSAVSDAEGRFELKADAEGPLVLEIAAAGYPTTVKEVPAERRAEAGESEAFRIELFPGGRIRALVWDEEADRPCFGCTLTVTPSGTGVGSLLTNAEGEAISELLAAGEYQVSTVRQQSLGGVVTVASGTNIRLARVEPNKTAEVRFGERKPVVEVTFSPPPPPGWDLNTKTSNGSVRVPPDAGGAFPVRRSPGEPVALALGDARGLQVRQWEIPAEFDEPVLLLSLPQTLVRGTLRWEERPVAGEPIQLISAAGAVAASGWTDPAGSFQVPFLAAGSYTLTVQDRPVRTVQIGGDAPQDLGMIDLPSR